LYKALFFVEVAEAIKSGALNLLHSEKFRSLDEYMIQKADWGCKPKPPKIPASL
jgi:hypothetical protein